MYSKKNYELSKLSLDLAIDLFKKNEVEKTIVFFYHDPSSPEAMVKKTFSDVEKLNKYWDDLLKNW